MHHRYARAGCIALLLGILAGCSGDSDIRPVVAMDGVSLPLEEPVDSGRMYLMTGQYGLAVEALTAAVQAEPANTRALGLLGIAYDRLRRYDLADRYYAAAVAAAPGSVAALNNWGYSHLLRQDYEEAGRLLALAEGAAQHNAIVEANLQLLRGARAPGPAGPAPVETIDAPHSVRVGDHVTLVKRRAAVVRISPGLQLLVTRPTQLAASGTGE